MHLACCSSKFKHLHTDGQPADCCMQLQVLLLNLSTLMTQTPPAEDHQDHASSYREPGKIGPNRHRSHGCQCRWSRESTSKPDAFMMTSKPHVIRERARNRQRCTYAYGTTSRTPPPNLTRLRTSAYSNWLGSIRLIRGKSTYPRLTCMKERVYMSTCADRDALQRGCTRDFVEKRLKSVRC